MATWTRPHTLMCNQTWIYGMTNDTPRNDNGQWTGGIDPDDVLAVMPPGKALATREVSDQLDAPRRTVEKRLNELVDADRIEKRKPNQTTALWTRIADPEE